MRNSRIGIEDHIILAPRNHAERNFERLVETANVEPPTHVSLTAADLIIKQLREETSKAPPPVRPKVVLRTMVIRYGLG